MRVDTNKVFPIRSFTQTNVHTKKVLVGYTRSGYHEGRFWSDADINYYEAITKMIGRIEYMKNQKQVVDECVECV